MHRLQALLSHWMTGKCTLEQYVIPYGFQTCIVNMFSFSKTEMTEVHTMSRTFHVLGTMQVSIAIRRGKVRKAEFIN